MGGISYQCADSSWHCFPCESGPGFLQITAWFITLISVEGNNGSVISVNNMQNKFHDDGSILAVGDGPMDDRNQCIVEVINVEIRQSLSIGPHLIANLQVNNDRIFTSAFTQTNLQTTSVDVIYWSVYT